MTFKDLIDYILLSNPNRAKQMKTALYLNN